MADYISSRFFCARSHHTPPWLYEPPMKKTFPLHAARKQPPRVIESIKHEVRKYVKREQRKKLPEGFDLWEFACRVGPTSATAEPAPLKNLGTSIDAVAGTDASEIYIEIIAVPATRKVSPPVSRPPQPADS